MDTSRYAQTDFSAGVQRKTSWLLRRRNEVETAINCRFDDTIDGIIQRNGYTQFGSQIAARTAWGTHVANFDGGSKLLVAINNAGGTAIELYHVQSGSNTAVTISSPPNDDTKMHFDTVLNETYATGYSATDDAYMTPLNIQENLTTSTTRNLTDAPDGAKFVTEFDGLLLLMNCKIGSDIYPDRIYQGYPRAEITSVQGDQSGTLTSIAVDSTRFLKTGMAIDIYTKGTDTKVEDLTITAVDKAANTISFSSTAIAISDNDEIWLDGRKDEIAFFFNSTDPTPEESDFITIPQGRVSDRAITGWGKTNNRLFVFTKSSTIKLASRSSSPIVRFATIGCVSHDTIQTVGDWMFWLDQNANVRAYNDETGQMQIVSRGVARDYLDEMTDTQLAAASAGANDEQYQLYLGTINGSKIRLVYDVNANTWAIDEISDVITSFFVFDQSGNNKIHFADNNGKVFEDDSGETDNGQAIPWYIEIGNDLFGDEREKLYHGMYIFTENAAGTVVSAKINDKQPIKVGAVYDNVQFINMPGKGVGVEGNYINTIISNNGQSTRAKLLGVVHYYSLEESHAGRKR